LVRRSRHRPQGDAYQPGLADLEITAGVGHHKSERGVDEMRLQLALDATEHFALLPVLASYFDIVEVGTRLLKASAWQRSPPPAS